jgi:hypothetical protein
VTVKAMPRWNRTDPATYRERVDKAIRSGRWVKLNVFGNPKSAATVAWMVENGKGLRAFEEYVPGSFKADIRHDTEVWFKVK